MRPIIRRLLEQAAGFSPRQLFASMIGAWYEPGVSNGTCFTDTAGTTPATAESAVARINDLSGYGNNASQSTAANRPRLSAKYNYYLNTETFSNWTVCSYAPNTADVVAPDGTLSACKVTTGNASYGNIIRNGAYSIFVGAFKLSGFFKKGTWAYIGVHIGYTIPPSSVYIPFVNLDTLEVTTTGIPGDAFSLSARDVGAGWVYIEALSNFSNSIYREFVLVSSSGRVDLSIGVQTAYIWHPDLRLASTPANYPSYQRVGAATDYDTTGFPWRLVYDTTDSLTVSLPDLGGGVFSNAGSVYFATNVGMSSIHGLTIGTSYSLPALSSDIYGYVLTPERLSAVNESRLERYMLRLSGLAGADYLWESFRRNLLRYSEKFDNAPWSVTNSAIIVGNVLTLSNNSNSRIEQLVYLPNQGKRHTLSVTLSAAIGSAFRLAIQNGTTFAELATQEFVVAASGNVIYTITTSTLSNADTAYVRIRSIETSPVTTSLTLVSAQIEPGSTATAYQRINAGPDPYTIVQEQLTSDDSVELLLAQ